VATGTHSILERLIEYLENSKVMSYYQGNDNRLVTGGVKSRHRGKRKYELGGPFTASALGKDNIVRHDNGRGGSTKLRVIKANYVNMVEQGGKVVRTVIQAVERTPANVEYARRGIITKGTIVRVEQGLVRITSRPGRHGVLNGLLVEQKAKQS
jgi:small subunit ribosomal protein S8e